MKFCRKYAKIKYVMGCENLLWKFKGSENFLREIKGSEISVHRENTPLRYPDLKKTHPLWRRDVTMSDVGIFVFNHFSHSHLISVKFSSQLDNFNQDMINTIFYRVSPISLPLSDKTGIIAHQIMDMTEFSLEKCKIEINRKSVNFELSDILSQRSK